MTITTKLTIPSAALEAVEALGRAIRALNAADGPFAYGDTERPYGATQAALRNTLRHMLAPNEEGERAEAFAAFVVNECASNGENVEYQITRVIGWTLALTPPWGIDGDALIIDGDAGYSGHVPTILGGTAS